MNNIELMFDKVRELCMANGVAIDHIAKVCGINQNLVAKFFMEVMQGILDETEKKTKGN